MGLSRQLLETLDTDEEISTLLEAREPDHEFEPGKGPKVHDEHIVKLWKVVPGEIGGFLTDKGSYGILVKKEAFKKAPYSSGVSWGAPQGFWVYMGVDMAALAHAQPAWKTAYEAATGHHIDVDRLPYWYKERLQAKGELPLDFGTIEGALEKAGWKRKKERRRSREEPGSARHLIKRIGGVWVEIPIFSGHGSDLLFIGAGLPKGLPFEQWDAFHKDTTIEFRYRGKFIGDIEKAAQQVAAKVKQWKPKRAQIDPEKVSWHYRGQVHSGKAAVERWKTEAERIIMDDILRPGSAKRDLYGRFKPESTQSVVNNILYNYGLEDLFGVGRKQMAKMIRVILDRLAKQGKIEKYTGGRSPEWHPKD